MEKFLISEWKVSKRRKTYTLRNKTVTLSFFIAFFLLTHNFVVVVRIALWMGIILYKCFSTHTHRVNRVLTILLHSNGVCEFVIWYILLKCTMWKKETETEAKHCFICHTVLVFWSKTDDQAQRTKSKNEPNYSIESIKHLSSSHLATQEYVYLPQKRKTRVMFWKLHFHDFHITEDSRSSCVSE